MIKTFTRRAAAFLLAGFAAVLTPYSALGQWNPQRPSGKVAVIEVLDVGQGDSILIRSPEGKTALIDAGPSRDGALNALHKAGIRQLDLVILSHHHSDHYGGMEQVIRSLKPRYYLGSNSRHYTKSYLKVLQAVQDEGLTPIHPTNRPRKIELGSVVFTLFPQPPEDPKEENNNSVGLRMDYKNFSMLFVGDGETTERRWWLEHDPTLISDCSILKLAHHGSRNGTDARWLAVVKPELAVASLGKNNDYGHPHAETLSLLRRTGIPLLRTDQLGTIIIETDGSDWRVSRPNLGTRGHPKQADVDRVAANIPADESVTRAAKRAR